MEGPINFTLENRKEVFTFFESLLRNYQEPIYYEYIRGHVSKASPVVRKYVASKCKGEKLLEYFKLRKNYFKVDGTDVRLRKGPCLGRTRGQSECSSEITRGRKKGRINDKENARRSYSLCSGISDSTVASSPTTNKVPLTDEKLEHEDYVNRYFTDLVTRHDKVVPSSLDYDNLPKKVKRHLDLYYKKKVANYFANFPDKFSCDKEGNVSFKTRTSCASPIPLESSVEDTMNSSDSSDDLKTTKKLVNVIDHEILARCKGIEAMLFFTEILIKKKASLTVDQLGGYLSQAPKELRTFLKLNFNMLKNFFEEYSIIFLINSSGEVTLSNSIRNTKLTIEKMRRIVSKAFNGAISVQTMNDDLECIFRPVEFFETEYNSTNSELAESPINETEFDIIERQPNSGIINKSSSITSDKSNCIEVPNDKKVTEETVTFKNSSKEFSELTKCSNESPRQTYPELNGTITDSGFNTKSKVANNSSVKVEVHPNSKMESKTNEIPNNESEVLPNIESEDRTILEFFLMFELFCLEVTEKDFEFTVNNELNAIQYFIEVLSEPLLKDWTLNSLHGTVGKASSEVSTFLNKKYKGDKFASFFEHQTEFIVEGQFVKLAPSYKETFSKRQTALSVSVNRNSKWDLLKLYESNCYQEVSSEVGALFYEICNFLENKTKTKLSRLEGIVTRFPRCLEWIKALNEETLAKKIGRFFSHFSIFKIFTEDYIYFTHKGSCDAILYFFEKAIKNEKINFGSLISVLMPSLSSNTIKAMSDASIFELSKDSCCYLKSEIRNEMPIRYCGVVKILPAPILLEIYNIGVGTRTIIDTMLKSGEFFFRNGKIDLKSKQNISVCSEDSVAESLIVNDDFQIQTGDLEKKENNISIFSTESNTSSQQTDEIHSIHCTNCHNTFLCDKLDVFLDDSCTPNEASQSSTSAKICYNKCNQTQLESSSAELDKWISKTLDSKEVIEIESTCNAQILSQKNNAISPESIVCVEDFAQCYPSLNSTKCNDPVDVFKNTDKQVLLNTIDSNSDDDFDSFVEEIASGTNHSVKSSLSSLEDEFESTNEENINILDANGIFAEIKCLEDACVSSHLQDNNEGNISSDVKPMDINSSLTIIEQYIDLLNEDDELVDNHENIDNFGSISNHNKTFLNQPLTGPQDIFANDLNLSPTEIKVCGKQNVSDMSNNERDEITRIELKETSCKIDGYESASGMKYKAELLAKEVFQSYNGNIQRSKIFIACSNVIFLFKKNHLSKVYGPFKCKKDENNKNFSVTAPISLNDECLNHSSDISSRVTLQDTAYPESNSSSLNMSLNNCKDTLNEYPLQQKCGATNKIETEKLNLISNDDAHVNYFLPKNDDSTNNSNVNLMANDSKPDLNDYPLQPILAEVVLLTADSCIAVAKIKSCKQNIYFLKCVFVCDHQFCCSDCFDDLKISDTVSCFVPPTEMSRKMWIAIMVSKETTSQFEEIDSFNEVLTKQSEGGYMNRNMCINSKSVSIQTERLCIEFGCQTESSSIEQGCQTQLCGEVKLCAITRNSMSQTNVSVQSAYSQTEIETKSSECQTDFSLDRLNVESQTSHSGEIKESPTCADLLCQTDLTGEVKLSINVVNTECQTISTGQVMITKYYHL